MSTQPKIRDRIEWVIVILGESKYKQTNTYIYINKYIRYIYIYTYLETR